MDDVNNKKIKQKMMEVADTIADTMVSDERLKEIEEIIKRMFKQIDIPFNLHTKKAFHRALVYVLSTSKDYSDRATVDRHTTILLMAFNRSIRKDNSEFMGKLRVQVKKEDN